MKVQALPSKEGNFNLKNYEEAAETLTGVQ